MKIVQLKLLVINLIFLFTSGMCTAQSLKLGAYYFDGWNGQTRDKLANKFPERKPIWGWKTSTQDIVEEQIDLAADAGISFFSFCWYFKKGTNISGIADLGPNNALQMYLKAPNKNRLKFNLLVANHSGYRINANDWNIVCKYWCGLFKDNAYLTSDGKPIITFFDIRSLYATFKSKEKLIDALNLLRQMAVQNGLKGVLIAASVSSKESAKFATDCGFDILTGYNYHGIGLWNKQNLEVQPIEKMQIKEAAIWKEIAEYSDKPIIPAITLNWDHRPLDKSDMRSPRFQGYSPKSVENAISACKKWIENNPKLVLHDRIAVAYAWNEYGEGAWLTPTEQQKDSLLQAVKKVLK